MNKHLKKHKCILVSNENMGYILDKICKMFKVSINRDVRCTTTCTSYLVTVNWYRKTNLRMNHSKCKAPLLLYSNFRKVLGVTLPLCKDSNNHLENWATEAVSQFWHNQRSLLLKVVKHFKTQVKLWFILIFIINFVHFLNITYICLEKNIIKKVFKREP